MGSSRPSKKRGDHERPSRWLRLISTFLSAKLFQRRLTFSFFFFVCPLTQPKDGKCQAAYLRVCGSSSNSTNQLADCELEVSLCLTRVRHVPRAISHITSQNVDVSHRKMVTFSSYHRRMSDRYIDLLSQRRWFVLPRLRVNRSMHHDASGGQMKGRGVYNAIDDHQACFLSSKNQCSPGNVSDQSCPEIHMIGPSSRG